MASSYWSGVSADEINATEAVTESVTPESTQTEPATEEQPVDSSNPDTSSSPPSDELTSDDISATITPVDNSTTTLSAGNSTSPSAEVPTTSADNSTTTVPASDSTTTTTLAGNSTSSEEPISQTELVPDNSTNEVIQPLPDATLSLQFDNTDTQASDVAGDATVEENLDVSSLNLDGQGDFVQVTDTGLRELTAMSLSAWVKPDYSGGSSEFTVVSKDRAFVLAINNNIPPYKVAKFSIFDGIKWSTVESTTQIGEEWTHLAATFDGSSIGIYVNGNLESTLQMTGNPSLAVNGKLELKTVDSISSDSDIVIGAYLSQKNGHRVVSNQFSGLIYSVNIYDSLLNQSQISELYNNSSSSDANVAPTLTTDKADYLPEETVQISGNGMVPNEIYDIIVIRSDGWIVKNDGTDGFDSIVADSNGSFVYNYKLESIAGIYTVRVYESSDVVHSIVLASTTFTDVAPTLTTDKADYLPEETVQISGNGYTPDASYNIVITRPDGSILKGDGTFTLGFDSIVADSNGSFVYNYKLDGIKGLYHVTSYDSNDIEHKITLASTSFADPPAVAGPLFAGTAANQGSGWMNPTNAAGSVDATCATAFGTSDNGKKIEFSNFGFGIPLSATITGIRVQIDFASDIDDTSQKIVFLKAGVPAGTIPSFGRPSSSATTCPTSNFVTLPPTATNDLWGTTWTPAEINNNGFGVRIDAGSGGGMRFLDRVQITVFYNELIDTTPPDTTITSSPSNPSNDASTSFGFTSTELGVFECKLDAGLFVACISPQLYPSLSDGSHTFQVRAIDLAGNVDPTPSSFTWTIDTAKPITTITEVTDGNNNIVTSGGFTKSNTITFAFTADGTGSSITSSECKLDAGSYAACTTGKSYSGLSDGSHTVNIRSTDAAGNVESTATFTWTIDTTPPVITAPSAIIAEATSSAGATVSYSVTALDLVSGSITPTCVPASPSIFALGATTVTCSATDTAGNTASASFTVTVQDITPPVITAPLAITAVATTPAGATVSYSVTALDLVSGSITPICSAASGSTFSIGTTTVICIATDTTGNTASASFAVTVVLPTGLVISAPSAIIAEATSSAGATVSYSVTASSLAGVPITPDCIPPSGSTFSISTTTVTCTATDGVSTASATFPVTVVDTTAPVITVPEPITVVTSTSGAVVSYSVTAFDLVSGSITPICSAASGSTFSIGTTTVICIATDAAGKTGSALFTVTVNKLGPSILSITASDPDSGDAVYSAGDTITVRFSESTNKPDPTPLVAGLSKDDLNTIITFSQGGLSASLGNSYTAIWINPSTLVITIVDVIDATPPAVGGLTLTVQAAANLKNAALISLPSTSTSPPLIGSFGNKAGPSITALVADDPDSGDAVYSAGDTITVRFSESTNKPDPTPLVAGLSKDDLNTIITFSQGGLSASLGNSYTAIWINPSTLVITIVDVIDATPPAIEGLSVTVKDTANLKNAAVTSLASTATSPTLSGSFGTFSVAIPVADGGTASATLPSGLTSEITLPPGTSGTVTFTKTDSAPPSPDFAILGNVIDIEVTGDACATVACIISFEFTIDDVPVGVDPFSVVALHDANENGVFEAGETVPTTITAGSQPGTFIATFSASFFSKFAIGGVKALLGASLLSGGGGNNLPPSVVTVTFAVNDQSSLTDSTVIGFGGRLAGSNLSPGTFKTGEPVKLSSTKIIKIGDPLNLKLLVQEEEGVLAIEHIAFYINLLGNEPQVDNSDTYVIYEKSKPITVVDPHGFFSEVNVETSQVDALTLALTYDIKFAKPMAKSDIIIRSWDIKKNVDDTKLLDAIEVVEPSTLPRTIPDWVKNNANWWSSGQIADSDFVQGIQYLIKQGIVTIPETEASSDSSQQIPTWIKNNAGWWAEGLISDDDFISAMQWLITNGIMKV